MEITKNLTSWTFLYSAELISFSIALLFFLRSKIHRAITIWIISNVAAAVGMLTPSIFVETASGKEMNELSFLLSAISITIPYFALNYGRRTSWQRTIAFGLIFSVWTVSAAIPYGWKSSLLTYSAGSAIVLMSAWAAYKNRMWKGLWGHKILVTGMLICASLIFWRGYNVAMHRVGPGFNVDPAVSVMGMQMLVFTSFYLQIGFLSVVIGWDLRSRRLRDRRAARAFELSRAIIEEEQQIQMVAEERLDMLSLLTHEVRQPINNAQAALEALDIEVKDIEPITGESRSAISRAQSVLDAVTLSISNAILGVSLLDNENSISTRPVNATEIAELARSDCPTEQRFRVRMKAQRKPIYVDLDPVLVRLALRNLLDNALKYSPINSLVQLDICHDEARLGVSFRVTNQVSNLELLNHDIFAQRVRGKSTRAEGSGLGLFLVKKAANAHHGEISYSVEHGKHVTFDLFIPD